METCPTDRTNKKHNEHSKEAARLPQAASLFAGSAYPAQYRHLKPSYPTAAHSSAPLFRVGQNRRRPDNDTRPVLRRLPKLEYSAGYGEHGMITKNSRQPVRPRSKRRCRKRGNRENLHSGKTARQFAPCGRTEPFEKAPREAIPTAKPGLSGRRSTRETGSRKGPYCSGERTKRAGERFRRTDSGTVPGHRVVTGDDRSRYGDFEITLQMTILRKFACPESRTDGLRKIPEYILPGNTGIHGNAAPKIRNNETI